MPVNIPKIEFERLVREAILDLPPRIRSYMEKVAVVIEDDATQQQRSRGNAGGGLLLGLYEGTPRTKRGPYYTLALPDKITIFQKPLQFVSQSVGELREQVTATVRHEIAHHFGFDEGGARQVSRKRGVKRKP